MWSDLEALVDARLIFLCEYLYAWQEYALVENIYALVSTRVYAGRSRTAGKSIRTLEVYV